MAEALTEISVEGLLKAKQNKEYEHHVNELVEGKREMFN